MAENNSKDLLQLEANTTESKLLVCKKDKPFTLPKAPLEKPTMSPLPKSQVLGKVKDFLGVMSESNKKLLQEAKDNPNNYDIEVLSGKESEYIEMDLMLGVADLHTPEAVAAAESAISGYQPAIPLSENEDSSEEDEENEGDKINEQDNESGSQSMEFESKDAVRDSSCKKSRKQKRKPKKRPKIVELS